MEREIETHLFNDTYLGYRLADRWKNWYFKNISDVDLEINSDFFPISTFYSVAHWNVSFLPYLRSFFEFLLNIKIYYVLIFLFVCFLIYVLFHIKTKNGIYWVVGANGFSCMSVMLFVMLLFQAFEGSIYEKIAFLTSMFMFGLACGTFFSNRYLINVRVGRNLLFIEFMYIIFLLSMFLIKVFHISMVFYFFSFLGGLLTGLIFPLANSVMLRRTKEVSLIGGKLYGLDLIGAYFGSILMGSFFFPVFGFFGSLVCMIFLRVFNVVLIHRFHIST